MKSKRNNKQKDILFIFISSFIVVVAWIGFNIYHIWATSSISEDIQSELTPINPNFDAKTMQQLSTRENINPQFVNQSSVSAAIPTPEPQVITPPTTAPVVSGSPATAPSGTTQVAPSNSPINRLGQ